MAAAAAAESSSDSDEFEDDPFENLNENTINIRFITVDDLFAGK